MTRLLVVTACSFALVAACKKDEGKAATTKPVAATATDDVAAFLADSSRAMTPEIYEKLVLALATCTVGDNGIDWKCEAWKNLEKARNRNTVFKDLVAAAGTIGKKHIADPSPAVRLQSARMMGSIFGSDPQTQEIIVDAAYKEKEPAVLKAMLAVVGSRHKSNPKIKDLLMVNANHPNEKVRIEAMSWFLTTFGEGVPGTFERVIEHVDKDPSEKVRAFLCSRLYGSGDERALKEIELWLTARDTSQELKAGCWEGAITSWTGFPLPQKPQKKGYELTMMVLEQKPRTKDRPPWTGMMLLRAAKDTFKPEDKAGNEWFAKVKGFYKKDKLIATLSDIVDDPNANWMARAASLDVLVELGTPKATFEKLQKKYEKDAVGDNAQVKRKLDDIVKKLGG